MLKLRKRKYRLLLSILILVLFIVLLVSFAKTDKFKGKIMVKNASASRRVLSSVGNTFFASSKGYDEVEYKVNYTLDQIEGVTKRDVIIRGKIDDLDSKYAYFKEIHKNNVTSTLSNNGREIEVRINDVTLGEEHNIKLKIVIEGAPNGKRITPKIYIKESTGEETKISAESILVETRSVEGTVTDEDDLELSNIELSLYKGNKEIRRTYTDERGKFLFTDLEDGEYNIHLEEDNYELINEVVINDETNINIKLRKVDKYNIKVKKYIQNLKLIVNGKEYDYSYNDLETVTEAVKNAKTISGKIEYKITVTNKSNKNSEVIKVIDEKGEGLSFDKDENLGWEEVDDKLYYRPIERATLSKYEQRDIRLVLNIDDTKEIKTYLNRITSKGEIEEKVSYILNNELVKEEKVIEGEKVSRPNFDIDNLDGWYTDKNYTNKYNFNRDVTKDIILYARIKSETNKYSVEIVDKNPETDEESMLSEEEVTEGDNALEISNNPSHTGYKFKCFMLNGECYDFDTPVYNDIRLVSSYTKNKYDVIFIKDGEEYTRQKVEYKDKTESVSGPLKQYFTFKYWSLSEDGEAFDFNTKITENITLYSVYEKDMFEIKFIDIDTIVRDETVEAGTIIQSMSVSKDGYNFRCWSANGNTCFNFSNPVTTNITLYSLYETIDYNIKYNGLTNSEIELLNNPISYNIETDTFTLNNPSNRYDSDNDLSEIFVGWTYEGNSTPTMNITIELGTFGKKEYTANFIEAEPNTYTITYDLNGGTLESNNPNTFTKKTNTFTLNNPSKDGYTFIGWSGTDLNSLSTEVSINKGTRKNLEFTANFEPIEYSITYNLNGGSVESNNLESYTIETESFVLNNPSKEGYTFTGWTGTNIEELTKDVHVYKGTMETLEFTAHYEPINYNITYNLNGGLLEEGKTNNKTYTIETNTFTLNNPSKDGYRFLGWIENENDIPSTEITVNKGTIGDKSFTAVYEIIPYSITYELNGGTLENNNIESYTVEANTFTLNNPTKEGYTFIGWSGTGLSGNVKDVTVGKGSTGNRSYTAHFEINKYSVTFMNENTIFQKVTNIEYKNKVTVPSTIPTKPHNLFIKWVDENDNEFDFDTLITEDITLYAKYEEVVSPAITHSPLEWTKDDVTVSISSNNQNYSYIYKIDNGEYTNYEGEFTVSKNSTIYAYSVINNITSVEVTHDITNIDKINPILSNLSLTNITPVQAEISFNLKDNESGINKYKVYLDDEEIYESSIYENLINDEKIESYVVTGLEEESSYNIKVEIEDKVGNTKSEEINVLTPAKTYLCKIVSVNNTDLGEDFIKLESLKEALEYNKNGINCLTNSCKIELLNDITEDNVILNGQDITIDLNGKTITGINNNTFINNGKLQIINSNLESTGGVVNIVEAAIKNNGTLVIGELEEQISVSKIDPVIEGNTYGIENNGTLEFFDGKIIGDLAVKGEITETPYSYNASVKDDLSLNKQVATLEIIADAEARIRSVYYTKLQGGVDESKNGSYIDVDYTKPIISQLRSDNEYRFIYDDTSKLLVNNNQGIGDSTAHSYIKLDLTNYEANQVLTVNAEISSEASNDIGYVTVTDSEVEPSYTDVDGRFVYLSGTKEARDYTTILEKGKIYYLHIGYRKNSTTNTGNDSFIINKINIGDYVVSTISDISNAIIMSDSEYYFKKLDDGSLKSTNDRKYETTADSYFVIDMTNVVEEKYILIDASISSYSGYDAGYITVTNSKDVPTYSQTEGRNVYISGTIDRTTYPIKLIPGELNFVHLGYYVGNISSGYERAFTIHSIRNAEEKNVSITDGVMHNNGNYYFENVDYAPYVWNDLSGNNNYGSLMNTSLNEEENGFVFSGNSYVPIQKINLDSFTWEVKFSTNSAKSTIMANGGLGINVKDQKVELEIYIDNGYKYLYSLDTLELGKEYVASVTYENEKVTLYLDGVYQSSYEGTKLIHPSNNTVVMLGSNPNGQAAEGNYFNGTIYNARIYNKVLNDNEVNTNYRNNLVMDLDASNYKDSGNMYVNNNKGINSSTAVSYMTFDLTNSYEDKYLLIDALISSESNYDMGYITVTDSMDAPSYNQSSGRYVYISGRVSSEYRIKLTKGMINYVHFGYFKDSSTSSYNDSFVIRSIRYYDKSTSVVPTYIVGNYQNNNIDTYQIPKLNDKVDTVQMLRDIVLTKSLEIDETRNVVLDLNGYTLTTSKDDYVIKNNGTLKIIDSKYTGEVEAAYDNYERQNLAYQAMYEQDLIDFANMKEGFKEYLDDNTYLEDVLEEFGYTGKVEKFTAPYTGKYKIEAWGASGGKAASATNMKPGYGGYSRGEITLNEGDELYIVVGGQGQAGSGGYGGSGGYNGGAAGTNGVYASSNFPGAGGGGGATHIATVSGLLQDLESYKGTLSEDETYYESDKIIMVAGGGGGAAAYYTCADCGVNGGSGGGAKGVDGKTLDAPLEAIGGSQTTGYRFGLGEVGRIGTNSGSSSCEGTGGGGGGFFGGKAQLTTGVQTDSSGSGGSGYIANKSLTNKVMVVYTNDNSYVETNENYKTLVTEEASDSAETDKAKIGDGFVRISSITKKSDHTIFDAEEYMSNYSKEYSYTGQEEIYEVPATGKYRIETWGAQGGTINSSYIGGYGGYSTGILELQKGDKLYINVGGQGSSGNTKQTGGYNGGGTGVGGYCNGNRYSASGGGATSISLSSGLLSTKKNNVSDIVMVAGGGGGSNAFGGNGSGASGGGEVGNSSTFSLANGHTYNLSATGGTQDSGGIGGNSYSDTRNLVGSFGQGGSNVSNSCSEGAGGGGGFFGGGGASFAPGGGGSGYTGYSNLIDGYMTCYNCENSTNPSSVTYKTTNHSPTPESEYAKEGNGYARITLVEPTLHQAVLDTNQVLTGNITSTTGSIILNNYDGNLEIKEGILNINKSGNYDAITNRGIVKLDKDAYINGLQDNNIGINNTKSGQINESSGTINMNGKTSKGIYNTGVNYYSIKGLTLNSKETSSYNIYNNSIEDLILDNITSKGSGIDIYQNSDANLTINNSNLESTSNESFSSNETSKESLVTFYKTNVKNRIYNRPKSKRKIVINNSTLSGTRESNVYNFDGTLEINNSTLTHTIYNIENFNIFNSNNSTFNCNYKSIRNGSTYSDIYNHPDYVWAKGTTTLNNTIINTKGTSDDYVIDNRGDKLEIIGGTINNESSNSIVIYNEKNPKSSNPNNAEVIIRGNFKTSDTFSRVIDNIDGKVTVGENDNTVSNEYPLLRARLSVIKNDNIFNYYDGKLIGIKDNTINGVITSIPNIYDIDVNKDDTLETVTLKKKTVTVTENEYVAKIGNTKYYSLQEAIDAVPVNNTETEIVLLKDIETKNVVTISENKNIVINQKNHYIKSYSEDTFITNNGKLTFKDDSNEVTAVNSFFGKNFIINNGEIVYNNVNTNNLRTGKNIITNNGKFTMNSGKIFTILSSSEAIIINNDEFKVNDGTISTLWTKSFDNNGKLTVLGGTIQKTYTDTYWFRYSQVFITNRENGEITINGGYFQDLGTSYTFDSDGSITITGGTFKQLGYSDQSSFLVTTLVHNKGTLDITGGSYLSTGGRLVDNKGTANVKDITLEYVRVAYNSGTLTLNNVVAKSITDYFHYSVGTQLQNYGIENSGNLYMIDGSYEGTTIVESTSLLDINGTILNTTASKEALYLSTSNTTVIKNASITSKGTGISKSSSGTLSIDNTNIESTSSDGLYNDGTGSISITKGTIKGSRYGLYNTAAVTITIGTKGDLDGNNNLNVSKTNPKIEGNTIGLNNTNTSAIVNFYDGLLIGDSSNYGTITEIEEDYEVISEIVDSKEHKYLDRIPIVKNFRTGTEYYTIEDGISNAELNDKIILLRDATILPNKDSVLVDTDKNIIFDLNGHTLTTNNDLFLENKGTLKIINGLDSEAGITTNVSKIFKNSGSLILDAGLYNKVIDGTNNVIENNGSLIINRDVTIKTNLSTCNVLILNNGELEVNGGSIFTKYTKSIENNGTLRVLDGEIKKTFTDNSDTSASQVFISNSVDAEITISGGEFNDIGTSCMIDNYGTVTITGGTFKMNGHSSYYYLDVTTLVNNKGTLYIDGGTYPETYGRITINSGTATIKNITVDYTRIAENSGTLTVTDVNAEKLKKYDPTSWGYKPVLNYAYINTGTLNITGGSYDGITLVKSSGILNLTSVTHNVSEEIDGLLLDGTLKTTIKDSVITSKGNGISRTSTGILLLNNTNITSTSNTGLNNTGSGEINILSGTIEGETSGIQNTGDFTLTIGTKGDVDANNNLVISKTNPRIKGTSVGLNNASSNSVVNFYDGEIIGSTSIIGTINNIEANCEIISNTENALEHKYLDRLPVVKNKRTNVEYYTIREGINSAASNDTLVLIRSATILPRENSLIVEANKNIIFDLNGYKINTSNELFLENKGTLKIIDDTLGNDEVGTSGITSNVSMIFKNSGTLTIEKGTYEKLVDGTNSAILNTGNLYINGTSIIKTDLLSSVPLIVNNNVLEINGASVLTNVTKAIQNTGNLKITSGNIKKTYTNARDFGYSMDFISNSSTGEITISGGNFQDIGTSYTINNDGIVTITGGTFKELGRSSYRSYYGWDYYKVTTLVNNKGTLNITGGTYPENYGRLVTNSGTAIIKDITSNYIRVADNTGTLTLENVNAENLLYLSTYDVWYAEPNISINNEGSLIISGGSYIGSAIILQSTGNLSISNSTLYKNTDIWTTDYNYDTLNISGSNNTIIGSTIKSYRSAINLDGSLSIDQSTIKGRDIGIRVNSGGSLDISSSNISFNEDTTLMSTNYAIYSSSNNTININGGNYSAKNACINNEGSNTININSGTFTSESDNAIYNNGNSIINLGIVGGTPDSSNPIIYGKNYGFYNNNNNAIFNFYDGKIIGETGSVYGTINETESGYKEQRNTVTDPETNVVTTESTLTIVGETERVAVVNNINFTSLQSAINYAVRSNISIVTLYKNVILEDNLTKPDGIDVNIYLNGNTITNSGYTISEGINIVTNEEPEGLGGAIYKFLANVMGTKINPKNIVIYQMNDGNMLDSTSIYKLYKLDNNEYKIVKVNEDSVGNYSVGNKIDELRTNRGKIYINDIGEGSYKLVSIDKELLFEIKSDSVSENIRINNSENDNRKSTSLSTLILTLQTGTIRYPFIIIIMLLIIMLLSLIAYKKYKYEENDY